MLADKGRSQPQHHTWALLPGSVTLPRAGMVHVTSFQEIVAGVWAQVPWVGRGVPGACLGMGEVLQVPCRGLGSLGAGGGPRRPVLRVFGSVQQATNAGGRWLEEASPLIWAVITLPLEPGFQAGL